MTMRRIIVVLMASAALMGQAQAPAPQTKGTEKITPQAQAQAKNLIQEVKTAGCIRAWKPAPDDPAKPPENRQPGVAGVFLLTPVSATPNASVDQPTYLLVPSANINFQQHLGHRVEVTGTAQTAPLPPTVQEIATAPSQKPENKPSTQSMPRLAVTALKMVSQSCP
jgi:hypothetical protein